MTTGPSVSLSGKGVTGGVQPTLHGSGAAEATEPFDSGSGATPVTVPSQASVLTKQEAAATQTCQPRHSGFNADQTSPVQSIGAVHPAALPPSPAPTAQGTPHQSEK